MSLQDLQVAYVLHTRPYRNTSVMLDVFSAEQGRITVIARGARRPTSPLRSILQPFVPVLMSWMGKGDLVTLRQAESHGHRHCLQGQRLISGLYLNELLIRLLSRCDPYPVSFSMYQQTLTALASQAPIALSLRLFEKTLLKEMGYELQLSHDRDTGEQVRPDAHYHYEPESGVSLVHNPSTRDQTLFKGKSLLALHGNDLSELECLRDAKRLMRLALAPLLGHKPLHSQELWI